MAEKGPRCGVSNIKHDSACTVAAGFIPGRKFSEMPLRLPARVIEKRGDMSEHQGAVIAPVSRRLVMTSPSPQRGYRIPVTEVSSGKLDRNPAGISEQETKETSQHTVGGAAGWGQRLGFRICMRGNHVSTSGRQRGSLHPERETPVRPGEGPGGESPVRARSWRGGHPPSIRWSRTPRQFPGHR